MHHLGVELESPDALLRVFHRRRNAVRGFGDAAESGSKTVDVIAVAHPDFERSGCAGKKRRLLLDGDRRASVLTGAARRDDAAEELRRELHPVTDAEDRNAELKQLLRYCRGALVGDAHRSAGDDDARQSRALDSLDGSVPRQNLAVYLQLPDSSRDELRELGAAIEYDDVVHKSIPPEI